MFKPLLLLPAVLLLGSLPALTAAPAPQAGSSAQGSGKATAAGSAAHAKKLYEVDCAICHGASGDGKTSLAGDMKLNLDDWTDPKTLAGKTDEQLFDIIRKGKDKMPPEDASRAKNDEVHGLINYIRNLSKGTPSAAPAVATPAAPAPGTN